MKDEERFLLLSSLLGFLGVAAGAFGAHVLKTRLTPDMLIIFGTGSRYVLIHAVMLGVVSLLHHHHQGKWTRRSGWCFVVGMSIFGGSLWMLALTGVRWLGAITPIGGAALLAGWLCLGLASLERARSTVGDTGSR
jgi:uncharacterized membrane protein YgdD (TMEM256/DUF423 family)